MSNQLTNWQQFLQQHKGHGMTIHDLSQKYRQKVMNEESIQIRQPFKSHCRKLTETPCKDHVECKWYPSYIRNKRTSTGSPRTVKGHCRGDHTLLLNHYALKNPSDDKFDYPKNNQIGYNDYKDLKYTSKTRIPISKYGAIEPSSFHRTRSQVTDDDDFTPFEIQEIEGSDDENSSDDNNWDDFEQQQQQRQQQAQQAQPAQPAQPAQQRPSIQNPKQRGDTKRKMDSKYKKKDRLKSLTSKSKSRLLRKYEPDNTPRHRTPKTEPSRYIRQQQTQQQTQQQRQY